nr:hypothetical protein [Tanacetum cinerariifolium]
GSGTDEGTGSKPGVPDVPSDDSEEEIWWNSSDDEDVGGHEEGNKSDESDDERDEGSDDDSDETVKAGAGKDDDDNDDEDDDDNDEEEELAKSDEEDTETGKGGDEVRESEGESDEEETRQEEEKSFDPIPRTPEESKDESNDEEDQELRLSEETRIQEEEDANELYRDYMTQQMTDVIREAVQIQTDRLQDSIQRENDEFLRNIDKNIKKIIKGQVKNQRRREDDDQEGPFAGSNRGSKRQKEGGEHASVSTPSEKATEGAGRSTTGSQSRNMSATAQRDAQSWISDLARQTDDRSSFNELLDTPIDFFNFIMYRLNVDTLTPDLLAGPTYELMRGSCTSLTELEYHLEKVYKATTNQLDWVNPEGQQYPHNLLQPLPLIPNNQGRRVISFEHFINNDLEYLRGGTLSCKYTTSITKTKAADYGHIKWIEDLVPRAMWIQQPIDYNKHALWGVSHWGRKRKQFYGYAVNRESAIDVYSKRRIIAVIELKIVEWHDYKHLDWILVCREDDKIYKFKEGDLKRLRLQDIEDMLLLLVQGKLSNLTVEERFAFNVSLRMFTMSIVIKRRVEDLQLGVESYQKRLNLTKPDTYRPDLKRREAYTAHSNPRGFIYQNKDKKNRLMRIDELHKFSDKTLNDVRNALDDRLKGIWM